MKLHKSSSAKFYKTNVLYEIFRKFTKAEKEKSGENFFVHCLSPIPFTLQEQFTNEPYVFEGLCSNKRMKNLFGIKEEEIRKAISNVSSLL